MVTYTRHTLAFKVLNRLANALLLALLLAATSLAVAPVPGRAQGSVVWTFEGGVYKGEVGNESQPLQGVTVRLYGAYESDPGSETFIRSITTDENGWYGLNVLDTDPEYDYYSIRETDPPGYTSSGATTVGGEFQTSNWIRYEFEEAEGKFVHTAYIFTGNKFWDRRPPAANWIFSGRVHEGEVGDESHPLQGVTVEVYGTDDSFESLEGLIEFGELIARTTTDENGWYGLEVSEGYEFYSIRALVPPEYEPAGATTVDGTVRANDWIEYVIPLEGKTLTGDKFWLRGPAPEREGPDLTILSADAWHFEGDGWVLVLHVEIANQGSDKADGTALHIGDLDAGLPSSGREVPDLYPGQVTSVDVPLDIPEEQRGTTHRLWVEVDPDDKIRELDEGNNTAETPGIAIPPLEGPRPVRCSEGEVLYQEDLNDGQAQGWEFEQAEWGEWWVGDDLLNGKGHVGATYREGHWEDGCLTFKLRCLAGGLHANVRLGDTGRYAIGFGEDDTRLTFHLFKQLWPDTFIDLAVGEIDYYPNTLESEIDMRQGIDVLIETRGGQIQVSVEEYDENPVITYTDLDPLPPGTIGFETLDESRACVDDIVVIGQPSAPPPTERPATRTPVSALPATERPPARTPMATPRAGGPVRGPAPPWALYVAGAVAVLGGLGFLIYRTIRPGPERRGRRPRKPPVIPVIPPVRLIKIWLTEGGSGTGRLLTDHEPLIVDTPYSLHLQVLPREAEGGPDAASQAESEEGEKTKLEVVFFSPETDFELERKAETLDLPRGGASNEIHRPVKPLQTGKRRVRACVYYKNVLLQSVLLEASVIRRGPRIAAQAPGGRAASVARTVDYVASVDLISLEALPQPALSIFANQVSDATHWIGTFTSGDTAGFRLRTGDVHTFGPGELATMAEETRELLAETEGKRTYRLDVTLPLDVPRQLDRLEKDLARLACNGYTLYDNLFFSHLDADDKADHLQSLEDTLRHPCIVSVARCRGESTSIPWAALYDHYLDTDKLRTGEIKLCDIFKYQLAANRWSADMTELVEKHDLLDDPEMCHNNPQCPLQRDGDGLTVCPFGFWGFLHQIEQPLQHVEATSVDQVPEEMKSEKFNQTSFLVRSRDDDVRIVIAVCPNIPNVEEHENELRALGKGKQVEIVCNDDRNEVLKTLSQGGRHLYYFYCHGEMEGHVFKLKLGPAGRPGYIAAADLNRRWRRSWPDQPQPLVILNACETMALTPELIHGFLGKLRFLGACGVVGSEVKVWTQLAQPFGSQLVERILKDQSVGEAFRDIRRHLLRQYNPLGLVYSYYAPATLHLHDPDRCAWCQAHPPTRVAGGSG